MGALAGRAPSVALAWGRARRGALWLWSHLRVLLRELPPVSSPGTAVCNLKSVTGRRDLSGRARGGESLLEWLGGGGGRLLRNRNVVEDCLQRVEPARAILVYVIIAPLAIHRHNMFPPLRE